LVKLNAKISDNALSGHGKEPSPKHSQGCAETKDHKKNEGASSNELPSGPRLNTVEKFLDHQGV
jgi:hypothetical protein